MVIYIVYNSSVVVFCDFLESCTPIGLGAAGKFEKTASFITTMGSTIVYNTTLRRTVFHICVVCIGR